MCISEYIYVNVCVFLTYSYTRILLFGTNGPVPAIRSLGCLLVAGPCTEAGPSNPSPSGKQHPSPGRGATVSLKM